MPKLRVIVESPYAGNIWENEEYARACMADCFRRGEVPYASHLLYTQPGVLDDTNPIERRIGMEGGFIWAEAGDRRVVYVDLGVSSGMKEGIKHAESIGQPVEFRMLPAWTNKGKREVIPEVAPEKTPAGTTAALEDLRARIANAAAKSVPTTIHLDVKIGETVQVEEVPPVDPVGMDMIPAVEPVPFVMGMDLAAPGSKDETVYIETLPPPAVEKRTNPCGEVDFDLPPDEVAF